METNVKSGIAILLALAFMFILCACGGKAEIVIDYADAGAFEAALNRGENLEGKTVQFVADELHPNSAMGYNIWAGEHLNFISSRNPDINAGDMVTVKATKIESSLGSWFISYEKIDNAVIGDSTISSAVSESEPYTSGDQTTRALIPLDAQADVFVAGMTDPDENHRVISVSEDSINFGFWVDGMAAMIETYQSPLSDGTDFKASFPDDWNGIVSAWVKTSEAELDLLDAGGTPDAHLIVCMLDDRDQSNVLLGIYDGEVITDVVNGIEK